MSKREMIERESMLDAIYETILDVEDMAINNAHKRPAMTTLIEEVAEAVLAARGKHNDPLDLELMQIASVAVNLLAQLRLGAKGHVQNIGGR